MRCPKCSYISFDHLASCTKCGNDLTELITQLHGTAVEVEPPFFLGPAVGAFGGDETLGELIIDEAPDTEQVMEEAVDFQLEPDFDSGSDVDFAGMDGDETVDFQLDDAAETAAVGVEAEDAVDFSLEEEPAAGEEAVLDLAEMSDEGGPDVVEEEAFAVEVEEDQVEGISIAADEDHDAIDMEIDSPVSEEPAVDQESLDATLADLDDLGLDDLDLPEIEEAPSAFPPTEELSAEPVSADDEEVTAAELDEMFAGLDLGDEIEEAPASDQAEDLSSKLPDLGGITLELDESDSDSTGAVSDLDLTLEIDDE